MADIKLGLAGAQVTLPSPIWPSGAAPDFPYEQESSAEEDMMLDGSLRVNVKSYSPGTWTVTWDGATWANVQTIWGAAALNAELVYKNEHTDNADHNVYVKSRGYSLKGDTAATTARYVVTVVLREIP
jgi:hypothetical protein